MNSAGAMFRDDRISKWLFVLFSMLIGAILASLYGYVFLNRDQLGDVGLVMEAHCPGCNGPITMWDQVASREPDSVRCSEGNELIRASMEHLGVLKAAANTSFALIALLVMASAVAKAWRRLRYSLVVFFVYWALLELGMVLLVFNYAELSVS